VAGLAILMYSGAALALSFVALVLVSACPCALSMIPSLACKTGMSKASLHGVHFKSPEELEKANRATAVVFDLNGTLTTGQPKVIRHGFDKAYVTENEFFAALALMENGLKNPVPAAICQYANNHQPDTSNMTMEFMSRSHCGIQARMNDEICLVGNEDFLKEHQIDITSYFDT